MHRQTIMFSSFEAPELNAVANSLCNHAGSIHITCRYSGVLSQIVPQVCTSDTDHAAHKVQIAGSMMANSTMFYL